MRVLWFSIISVLLCCSNQAWAQDAATQNDAIEESLSVKFGGQVRAGAESSDDETTSGFVLRRARIWLNAQSPWPILSGRVQMAMDSGAIRVRDFQFFLTTDHAQVWVGQGKLPMSRAFLTSGFALQLLERSRQHDLSGAARDIGVMVRSTPDSGLEWRLGVFNGTGEDAVTVLGGEGSELVGDDLSNDPDKLHPALVGRLAWHSEGTQGYKSGDLEGGPLRGGLGFSARFDPLAGEQGGWLAEGQADGILKLHGASLEVAGLWLAEEGGRELRATYAQAGYVIAGRVEPVARYEVLDQSGDFSQEILGGLNVYLDGRRWKLQMQGQWNDDDQWGANLQLQARF